MGGKKGKNGRKLRLIGRISFLQSFFVAKLLVEKLKLEKREAFEVGEIIFSRKYPPLPDHKLWKCYSAKS